MSFEAYSEQKTQQINTYIEKSLLKCRQSVSQRFAPLIEAMAYSLEGTGKRLRPLLVLASGEFLGIENHRLLPAACALEYIHTYSLIHDDLPALDDDDERRGKPSNHKKFGEAIAILTGDALLTEAFQQMNSLVTEGDFTPDNVLKATQILSQKAGLGGMVGGQLLDVNTPATQILLPELEFIHIHKTGALIVAAVKLPAILAGVDQKNVERLRHYGENVGLAFQISDDLLDASENLRYARQPRKKPRPTYLQLMGSTEARERLNSLVDSAIDSIKGQGKAEPLIAIANFIKSRKR